MAKMWAPVEDGKIPQEESEGTNQCKPKENTSAHPPRIDQIIRALNLQARYELGAREGKS